MSISPACDWPKMLIGSRDTPKEFLSQNDKEKHRNRQLMKNPFIPWKENLKENFVKLQFYKKCSHIGLKIFVPKL